MRSLRFEPGTIARHASDLAGHCQRCPDGFYRGNCDGGGSSSESTDVDSTNNGDTERQDNNDVKNDEASGDAGAASLLSDDAGVEDAVQPADDSANDEGDIALAVEDADGYTQINTAQDLYDYLQNDKKTGKFRLNADVEYASDITLGAGEVTLDLKMVTRLSIMVPNQVATTCPCSMCLRARRSQLRI